MRKEIGGVFVPLGRFESFVWRDFWLFNHGLLLLDMFVEESVGNWNKITEKQDVLIRCQYGLPAVMCGLQN